MNPTTSGGEQGQPPEQQNAAVDVFERWLARIEAGQAESIQALCREHPALTARLLRLERNWRRYRRLLEGGWQAGLTEDERRRLRQLTRELRRSEPGSAGEDGSAR